MDIDLLSKMISELILDNDEVTLPGVGTFVAEVMPSTFSDKGYTINPPYRKLSFRQRATSDISLIDFYARSNGLDTKTASSIMTNFLDEMTEILKTRKVVVFPGLGRLRATKENNFFFIADEDLNIYPEGFGLEPLSLKTHVETDDDVVAAVEGLQSILDSPDADLAGLEQEIELVPVASPVTAEPVAEIVEAESVAEEPVAEIVEAESVAEETVAEIVEAESVAEEPVAEMVETEPVVEEPTDEKVEAEPVGSSDKPEVREPVVVSKVHDSPKPTVSPKPRGLMIALIVLAAVLVLLGLFVLLAHVAPDFVDRLLYSPEELEIIRQI